VAPQNATVFSKNSAGFDSLISDHQQQQQHVDHGLMDQFMKHRVNFKGDIPTTAGGNTPPPPPPAIIPRQ
jgi:hypothetical protein